MRFLLSLYPENLMPFDVNTSKYFWLNSNLCLCLLLILVDLYNLNAMVFSSTVISWAPRRREPPRFATVFFSGIRSITGFSVLGAISVELAFVNPQTCLPNATAASWKPKHIPRYGMFFSLA